MFCWHSWKESSKKAEIRNVSPCCGKLHSIDHVTVFLKECSKCGKAKAWQIHDKKYNGMKFKADVKWARDIINMRHNQHET